MSVLVERYADTVLEVEEFADLDLKSKPVYNTPRPVNCRVVEETKVIVVGDGQNERTTLTVWIPPGQDYTPTRDDRFTYGPDYEYYVVREVDIPKRLDGSVSHIRLLCREA